MTGPIASPAPNSVVDPITAQSKPHTGAHHRAVMRTANNCDPTPRPRLSGATATDSSGLSPSMKPNTGRSRANVGTGCAHDTVIVTATTPASSYPGHSSTYRTSVSLSCSVGGVLGWPNRRARRTWRSGCTRSANYHLDLLFCRSMLRAPPETPVGTGPRVRQARDLRSRGSPCSTPCAGPSESTNAQASAIWLPPPGASSQSP